MERIESSTPPSLLAPFPRMTGLNLYTNSALVHTSAYQQQYHRVAAVATCQDAGEEGTRRSALHP